MGHLTGAGPIRSGSPDPVGVRRDRPIRAGHAQARPLPAVRVPLSGAPPGGHLARVGPQRQQ
eukprot:6759187-Pyramimonas_sp.AAC.1